MCKHKGDATPRTLMTPPRHVSVVDRLLEEGCKCDDQSLLVAVRNGHPSVVACLLNGRVSGGRAAASWPLMPRRRPG
jgi:hypothetical protein